MAQFTTITTTKPGTCERCGSTIPTGGRARWNGRKLWHLTADCPAVTDTPAKLRQQDREHVLDVAEAATGSVRRPGTAEFAATGESWQNPPKGPHPWVVAEVQALHAARIRHEQAMDALAAAIERIAMLAERVATLEATVTSLNEDVLHLRSAANTRSARKAS